jgi:hypothetical protein
MVTAPDPVTRTPMGMFGLISGVLLLLDVPRAPAPRSTQHFPLVPAVASLEHGH